MTVLQRARAMYGAALLALYQLAPSPCALASNGGASLVEANADIYGRWRIAKVLDFAAVTALDERQARALLGKSVRISKEAFVFNGYICKAPGYERTVEETARSLREAGHVAAVNMGLPDPVTVIDANCTVFYLKRPGVIVVHWDGVYFDAIRQDR